MGNKSWNTLEIDQKIRERWPWLTIKSRAGRYWWGNCPFCMGGKDRFNVWIEGNYWCRTCGEKGWLDEEDPNWKPDPDAIEKARVAQLEREQQILVSVQEWQQSMRSQYWRGWHDAMLAQHKKYWADAGVPEWAVDYYGLGYCPKRRFQGGEEEWFESPAFTIPVLDVTHTEVVNVQYRIVNVPEGAGKYRQENGIPAASFFALPEVECGPLTIVEGAKKAIVMSDFTGAANQIVGWPSATPHVRLIRQLHTFDRAYLILDPGPGYSKAVERAARELFPVPTKAVELAMKPDDAVLAGMTVEDLRFCFLQARKV